MRVVLRETVIRRDHSKGGSPSTQHPTHQSACQPSDSSLLLSSTQNSSIVTISPPLPSPITVQRWRSLGANAVPCTQHIKRPFIDLTMLSRRTTDDFSDLSLPDFFHVQKCVACHQFLRYRDCMNKFQRGLYGRGLESREESCGSQESDIVMLVSTSFTASIGMALYENNVVMEDRVSISIILIDAFIDIPIGVVFGESLTNEVNHLKTMIVALQDRVSFLEGEEVPSLERRFPMLTAPVVIDLTDDDEGTVVSDSAVEVLDGPVWPWREASEDGDVMGREAPPGLLVPIQDGIEENGRSTPQIVGEAERRFAQMEERGRSVVPLDEEADCVAEQGTAPEYDHPPSYFE